MGEVEDAEVLDMLQAMNTGHDGSLTTIHANSPRDALLRLETLVAMTGLNIPNEAVRRYISSAIHVIIHISRLVDGSRKVISLQEITGMEGNTVTMQEICAFEQTGIDEAGRVKGKFVMRGFLPKFMERFAALGDPDPVQHLRYQQDPLKSSSGSIAMEWISFLSAFSSSSLAVIQALFMLLRSRFNPEVGRLKQEIGALSADRIGGTGVDIVKKTHPERDPLVQRDPARSSRCRRSAAWRGSSSRPMCKQPLGFFILLSAAMCSRRSFLSSLS